MVGRLVFPGLAPCSLASVDLAAALNVTAGTRLSCKDLWNTTRVCGPVTAGGKQPFVTPVPAHSVVVLRFESASRRAVPLPPYDPHQGARDAAAGRSTRTRAHRRQPATASAAALTSPGTGTDPTGAAAAARADRGLGGAAWPMQGHDGRHTGRSAAAGPTSCSILWNFGNCTEPAPNPASLAGLAGLDGSKPCDNVPSGGTSMPVVSAAAGAVSKPLVTQQVVWAIVLISVAHPHVLRGRMGVHHVCRHAQTNPCSAGY